MTLLQKPHLNLLPIIVHVNGEGQGHAVDHVVESDRVPGRSRAPVAVVEVVNVAVVENEAEAVNDHVIENEAVVALVPAPDQKSQRNLTVEREIMFNDEYCLPM